MFHTLRTKLILSHLLVIAVGMALSGVLLLGFVERYLLDATAANLTAQAYVVARALVPDAVPAAAAANVSQATNVTQQATNLYLQQTYVPKTQSPAVQSSNLAYLGEVSVRLSSDLPTRIRVLDQAGLVLVDSQNGEDEGSSRAGEPGVAAALAGNQSVHTADGVMAVAVPLFHGEQVAGAVYLSQPLDDTLAVLNDLRWLLVLSTAVGVAVAGAVGLGLARAMSQPLRELSTAAAHLARGEFDWPLRVSARSARDEIGQLGDSFRRMSVQLQRTLDDLARRGEERQAILSTMADGVLAVDENGRVLFCNPVAGGWLDGNQDTVSHEGVCALLDQALHTGQPQRQEVCLGDRAVDVLVTPLAPAGDDGAPGGAVAVFHDVTGFRELEDLKTRFVGDVSHELRTPLTSIKGMAETLRAGAVDDAGVRDRFLGTIEAEADRLTALVNDLLVLTRADSHMLELQRDQVDLVALARESAERLMPQATGRRVRVDVEADGPVLARVDPYRIQQVLVNLLDNAVRYSPAGDTVTVTVAPAPGGRVRVSVRDRGPGIPPAAQPHIFERFTRADESRSSAASSGRGAGLGLSIAKALVEAHGGHIGLESAVGEGTTVSFTLPR